MSRRRAAIAAAGIVALVAIANVPTTTNQGVNFVVSSHSLPLYVKALDFIDRDVNYGRLAADVTKDARTEEAKMRAVFGWTRAHIRDTPDGFPILDDHIWHIVVRGYGQEDQKADVFTTLLSYAGVRAYWILIGPPPELVLSLAHVDGSWRPIDVANGVIFTTPRGLATVEELAGDRDLIARQGPPSYRGQPYGRYFERFHAPTTPDLTHAEMQMLWPRAWHAAKWLVGRGGTTWEMRPPTRLGGA